MAKRKGQKGRRAAARSAASPPAAVRNAGPAVAPAAPPSEPVRIAVPTPPSTPARPLPPSPPSTPARPLPPSPPSTADPTPTLHAASGRRALSGFFLSGLLLSLLGAFLPSWGYHLHSDYLTIGFYFLFLNCGIYAAFYGTPWLLRRQGIRFVLALGSAIAAAALIYLAAVSGPVPPSLRMAGLFAVGLSAAIVNTAIFHAITPMYQHDPASTVNLAGIFFGLGSLATSILIAGTFNTYSAAAILLIIACIPLFYLLAWLRARHSPTAPRPGEFPSLAVAARNFRSPGAILFTLLLFFQFGNEWAIAGWLPLFVVQRLGESPATGLGLLALYFAALLTGRIGAQALLVRLKHSRLLLFSVLSAFLGCLLLCLTATVEGAFVAILLTGAGFAAIYPLTAESIEHRFRCYHPGFYSGIFSLGLTGALLAPALLGFAAHFWGIGAVMWLPLFGSLAVFALVLAIWLEARLSRG
ncbi:MAG: MFS transporter [Acidobacteriota bacterium]